LVPTSAPSKTARRPRSKSGVRRSGWCRRRHLEALHQAGVAVRCPSIRLVPTSAPWNGRSASRNRRCVRRSGWCRRRHPCLGWLCIVAAGVSVDQVGADVGTRDAHLHPKSIQIVSVDQVGADVGTTGPGEKRYRPYSVRRSGWCRRRHPRNQSPAYRTICVSVDQVGADVGTGGARKTT